MKNWDFYIWNAGRSRESMDRECVLSLQRQENQNANDLASILTMNGWHNLAASWWYRFCDQYKGY